MAMSDSVAVVGFPRATAINVSIVLKSSGGRTMCETKYRHLTCSEYNYVYRHEQRVLLDGRFYAHNNKNWS